MENEEQQLGGVREQEGHWVAVSDLMAGLMMVFMLIAIVFMIDVERKTKKITDVAILYDTLRTQLYQDLLTEFEPDLEPWGAELDKDLTFRFNRVELLFDRGESTLKPEFRAMLEDFFPRYINIITQPKYREDILEVRIEGHTSSGWDGAANEDVAYILNMNLSQARTRSALAYLLSLPAVQQDKEWIRDHMTANGLSSAKLVYDDSGREDMQRSRRVEFQVRTDAEGRIATILDDVPR